MKFLEDIDERLYEQEEKLATGDFDYYEKRDSFASKIKNYDKAKATKNAWRKNKWKYKKGIKKFHRSIKGKKMHRRLARHMLTRIKRDKHKIKEEALIVEGIGSNVDLLIALSSLKTHLLLEYEYYMTSEEYLEYDQLTRFLFEFIQFVENEVIETGLLLKEDYDILFRLIDPEVLFEEMANTLKLDIPSNNRIVQLMEEKLLEEDPGGYYSFLTGFLNSELKEIKEESKEVANKNS